MAAVTHGVSVANTNQGIAYTTGSFTPAAGDLLVAFVVSTATNSVGSLTDTQTLGWTLADSQTFGSTGQHKAYLYVANSLAAASAMTVTFDPTGDDNANGALIHVARVSGMSKTGATAVLQAPSNTGSATTPSVTFASAVTTTNPTLVCCGNDDVNTPTEPAGWTERGDIGYITPNTNGEYASRNSGFTGTTVTWASALAENFVTFGLELDASGSAATFERAAAIAATAAITATGTFFSVLERAAAISATATITTAGQRDLLRSVAVSATGGIASQATFYTTLERAAAVSAVAAITSIPQRDLLRAASVGATGTVTSAGAGFTIVEGAASVSATAGIATTPQRDLLRAASVGATGAITASGQIEGQAQTHEGSASVGATAAVTSAGQRDLVRSSSVTATGAIASDSERTLIRSAIVNATGAVTTAYQRELVRAAALDAVGGVAVSGGVSGVVERAAVIAAIASIDATGQAGVWSYGPYPGETYGPYPGFTFGGTTSYTYTAGTAWTYLET